MARGRPQASSALHLLCLSSSRMTSVLQGPPLQHEMSHGTHHLWLSERSLHSGDVRAYDMCLVLELDS